MFKSIVLAWSLLVLSVAVEAANLGKRQNFHTLNKPLWKRSSPSSPSVSALLEADAALIEPFKGHLSPQEIQQVLEEEIQALMKPKSRRTLVTDCMHMASDSGEFVFESVGSSDTCGVYIVAPADMVVEITFEAIDVKCGQGLVVFFDGWEMNREIFPSEEDHDLDLNSRFTEMCDNRKPKNLRFVSGQNAALIQYRVPQPGQGFAFRIKFIKNPHPCNILMSEMTGLFTMENFGLERNCSLTTLLFPANFKVLHMRVGHDDPKDKQTCCKGNGDYLEFGGSMDLNSRNLIAKETVCGCDIDTVKQKGVTVLCGSSTVRMVSSGGSENHLSIWAQAAGLDDMDMHNNDIIMCPHFM